MCAAALRCGQGHVCYAAPGHSGAHLLCLDCDADGARAHSWDICSACYTEGLCEGACAALPCRHVFHVKCLEDLLRARWNGPRITFGFISCPLCRGPFPAHGGALEPLLAPLRALRADVEAMALKRVTMEGLWPPKADDAGKNAEAVAAFAAASEAAARAAAGAGAGAAGAAGAASAEAALDALKLDFAMARLSYYLCERPGCGKPFFAGLASCEVAGEASGGGGGGAAAAAPPPASTRYGGRYAPPPQTQPTLCAACRPPPPGAICKTHRDPEFVIWKCMYCCSVATHMCRGGVNVYCAFSALRSRAAPASPPPSPHTHTTSGATPGKPCHDIADLNARTNGTVLNWQPIIARDTWRRCQHTFAGGPPCPLGSVPHPALGVKYALGCAQCDAESKSLSWETGVGDAAGGGGGGGGGGKR